MASRPPFRALLRVSPLAVAAVTGWAVANGRPLPVLAFFVTATVVSAVGASEVVVEVASWYYVFQSALLGLFGVGLVLMGHGTVPVVALTLGAVLSGVVFAISYSRTRRTVPPPDRNAP